MSIERLICGCVGGCRVAVSFGSVLIALLIFGGSPAVAKLAVGECQVFDASDIPELIKSKDSVSREAGKALKESLAAFRVSGASMSDSSNLSVKMCSIMMLPTPETALTQELQLPVQQKDGVCFFQTLDLEGQYDDKGKFLPGISREDLLSGDVPGKGTKYMRPMGAECPEHHAGEYVKTTGITPDEFLEVFAFWKSLTAHQAIDVDLISLPDPSVDRNSAETLEALRKYVLIDWYVHPPLPTYVGRESGEADKFSISISISHSFGFVLTLSHVDGKLRIVGLSSYIV